MSRASATKAPISFEKTRTSETVLQRLTALRAPRKLRALELTLMIFALAVGVAAIVVIDLTLRGFVSMELLPTGVLFVLALFALHITVRKIAPDADPLLLPLATLLNCVGIAMIYRIDQAVELSGWNATSVRQLAWSTVALVIAILTILLFRNYLVLFRYTYLSGLAALMLLLLPMLQLLISYSQKSSYHSQYKKHLRKEQKI